jgi:apolipoprotein N-acyltransferase
MTNQNRWQSAACFLLGGLGLAFGQGHWPNGILLLIGLILWIRFVRITPAGLAIPMIVIANVLVWEWAYYGMVPMPAFARIGMFTGIAVVFGLLFFVDRWVNRRWKSLLATLVLPCGWAAFDLVSARLSPGGTWASISYTFADDFMAAQVASLAGWTGVTFLAVWLASVVNWIWDRTPDEPASRRQGLLAVAAVMVGLIGHGVFRLYTVADGKPVRVACIVAPNTFNDEYVNDLYTYTRGIEVPAASTARARERIQQSMAEHFALVESAAAEKPDFILWPEANAIMTLQEEQAWVQRAREIAMAKKVFLGMGLVVFRPGSGLGTMNKFVLVDPQGEVVMDFLKATRVPGSLNTKGDGVLPVIETEFGRISTAICFDMDFPHLIAQAGRGKTDLFLAPSNDWREARDTHARMAKMRAIEQGFALVRPTKDGTTLVTDSTGRTLTAVTLDDNRTGLIVVELPVKSRFTLYSVIGDAFGLLCGVGFIAIVLCVVWTKRVPV